MSPLPSQRLVYLESKSCGLLQKTSLWGQLERLAFLHSFSASSLGLEFHHIFWPLSQSVSQAKDTLGSWQLLNDSTGPALPVAWQRCVS